MTTMFSRAAPYLSALLLLAGLPLQASDAGQAEHVVVMVWDGMRPDFVRPQYTPALYRLAQRGAFFRRHHPAFVSSTEVNGVALITGAQPDRSGIVANKEYWPQLSWTDPGAMEGLDVVRRGDALSGGRFIETPTLTEIIQQAGFRTVVAGTKPVALVLDRSNRRTTEAARNSVNVYRGHSLPKAALEGMAKGMEEKAFPTNITYPNVAQDAWTTKTVVKELWKKDVPKFSIIWLSDPDYSQHDSGPGSNASLEALESADKNLALIVKALEEKGILEKTDIFVVSDHGFSTVGRGVDMAAVLKRSGFKAARKLEDPEAGEILVVGLGGSVALYVVEHDEPTVRALIEFLQTTDFAGVIFSRIKSSGTFALSEVRLQSTNAPDILFRFVGTVARMNSERPDYSLRTWEKARKRQEKVVQRTRPKPKMRRV